MNEKEMTAKEMALKIVKDNLLSIIFMGVLKILAYVGVALLAGFLLMYMFNNFVATTFNIGTINIFQAIGIDLIWSFLNTSFSAKEKKGSYWELIIIAVVTDVVFLGIAFVVAMFV